VRRRADRRARAEGTRPSSRCRDRRFCFRGSSASRFGLELDLDLLPAEGPDDPAPERKIERHLPGKDAAAAVLIRRCILFALDRELLQGDQAPQVFPVLGVNDAARFGLSPQNAFHGFPRFPSIQPIRVNCFWQEGQSGWP
jgi:hypothetical protein